MNSNIINLTQFEEYRAVNIPNSPIGSNSFHNIAQGRILINTITHDPLLVDIIIHQSHIYTGPLRTQHPKHCTILQSLLS